MRNFTLLAALLLCASASTAQLPRKTLLKKAVPAATTGKAQTAQKAKASLCKRKATAAQPLWRAATEEFYIYDGGEWMLMDNTTLTFDQAGNPLTTVVDEDGYLTRTTYTYDANNKETSATVENDESGTGEEWIYDTRTVKTYDPVVTDFMTSKMEYMWDDVAADWGPGNKQSQRKTVTRDAQGRVTSVEITAYFSFNDSWGIVSRTDIAYDEATGKATSYAYRQADDIDPATGMAVLGSPTVYKNLEWLETDGQLVGDIDDMLLGANRFTKADIYDGEGEDEIPIGTYEVTYTDGKEDFVVTGLSADGMEKEVRTYTTTDANGSFTEEIAYYYDENEDGEFTDDECERESLVMTYDAQGNTTLEEYRSGDEIMEGSRTTYTYDPTTQAVTEALTEIYSVEYDDETEEIISEGYQPMGKVVYSDFIDATVTAIGTAASATTDTVRVYNLQGVSAGTSVKNLPAGIYIIQKGERTYKMLKK